MYFKLKSGINLLILFFVSSLLTGCTENNSVSLCDVDTGWQVSDDIINPECQYLVVIGDIQEYTSNDLRASYLYKTCDWLRSMQHHYNNISAVLQNGDLTWNNGHAPWIRADHSLSHLGSDILFVPVIGNHDYTWNSPEEMIIVDRESSLINWMPNIKNLWNEEIECFEQGKLDNIIVPLKGKMKSWNIIGLEFGPRKDAVAWADSIVRAHPKKKYILMTHEWLTRDGTRIDKGSAASQQFKGQSYSSPQEIWDNMVYPNDNIVCVLCGHNGFCQYLFTPNEMGRKVCQVLFNLQYQENGGNGLVQLWEFTKDMKKINISVYNTIKRETYADESTKITIPIDE